MVERIFIKNITFILNKSSSQNVLELALMANVLDTQKDILNYREASPLKIDI